MRTILPAMLVFALPCAAQAQSMPVSTFLAKAEALNKKGAMALFSSDMALLKREMKGAAAELRAERLAAEKAGRTPAYCPPAKQAGFTPAEIVGHFRSIPAAERERMRVKDAFRTLLAKRYPCRYPSTPRASSIARNSPPAMKAKLSSTKVRQIALQRESR